LRPQERELDGPSLTGCPALSAPGTIASPAWTRRHEGVRRRSRSTGGADKCGAGVVKPTCPGVGHNPTGVPVELRASGGVDRRCRPERRPLYDLLVSLAKVDLGWSEGCEVGLVEPLITEPGPRRQVLTPYPYGYSGSAVPTDCLDHETRSRLGLSRDVQCDISRADRVHAHGAGWVPVGDRLWLWAGLHLCSRSPCGDPDTHNLLLFSHIAIHAGSADRSCRRTDRLGRVRPDPSGSRAVEQQRDQPIADWDHRDVLYMLILACLGPAIR
jgi:hypothetical protein